MSYDLLFLGPPRTATRSFWIALNNHPQISVSSPKEPFNRSKNDLRYLDNYEINENTKVLLDATPAAYTIYPERIEVVKKCFPEIKNIKILYPIRKPHDRLHSNIKQVLVGKYYGRSDWSQFVVGKLRVDTYEVMEYIENYFLDSWHIPAAKKLTKDILFLRFEKMWDQIPKVLDFIGVEQMEIGLPSANTFKKIFATNIFDNARQDLERIFRFNSVTRVAMNKFFKEDLQWVQKETKINLEDWIKQIEEENIPTIL